MSSPPRQQTSAERLWAAASATLVRGGKGTRVEDEGYPGPGVGVLTEDSAILQV